VSATWFRIYTGMIERGTASLAGIEGCRAKSLLTDEEHTQLLTAWHVKNDPPLAEPEPPAPAADPPEQEPASAGG